MSKFKIGDKVILVNDKDLDANLLKVGNTYTVYNSTGDFLMLTDGTFKEGCYAYRVIKIKEENKEMTAEQIHDEILRIDARIEEANKDIENAQNERNSLVEKLREKGFELGGTSNQYIKIGDRVEITGWSKERHEKSHIRRKGIIEKIDNTHIPFKVILDDENEDSNTWFEANQVKKI